MYLTHSFALNAPVQLTYLKQTKPPACLALLATLATELATKYKNASRARTAGRGWGTVICVILVSTRLKRVSLLATIALLATSAKGQIFSLRVAGLALMLMKLTHGNAKLARKEPSSRSEVRPNAWLVLLAIRAILKKIALSLAQKERLLPTRVTILAANLARSALERPV